MSGYHSEDLLILTKTSPQPSTKYREITCVAAVNRTGELRRIFPVPFRLLEGEQQFRKWEWIRVRMTRARGDQRPESYRIDTDSIVRLGERIGSEDGWRKRLLWIEPYTVATPDDLEIQRQNGGTTLGCIRPSRLLELEITPIKPPDWTEEEKIKLAKEGLFDTEAMRSRPPLRKVPYSFHYRYECDTPDGPKTYRHMITDWEATALYWKCVRDYQNGWKDPFRQKLEVEFANKALIFLMGTIHRFPDQWLIVGLVYPPRSRQQKPDQMALKLDD